MTSLQDLAREAIQVQDACNLSGVAHGFSKAMSDLRSMGLDSSACAQHPITLVWIDKLASLSGYRQDYSSDMIAAYREVERMAL